MNFMAESRIL